MNGVQVLLVSVGGIPLILLWLLFGGIFFTLRFGLINLRGLPSAIALLLDRDNSQDTEGEVSAFAALATALSGTVGLGNIAGVAIAIKLGGVGAVFWMSVAAFLGMASKFIECTLGQQYRQITAEGKTAGGPMYYLREGLAELGLPKLGQTLGGVFAFFCIGASFGGGNMFQVNQSFVALTALAPGLDPYNWLFGLMVAVSIGLITLGGINRIGQVTSKLVPVMIGIYLLACLWVIGVNLAQLPQAIALVWKQAFAPTAVTGGLAGTIVIALRRSVFSHGAGLGTAAIAHAAAKTDEPIKEGLIAILEPAIDTILICNLTALVIILTGTYGETIPSGIDGSGLTALAFSKTISWFPPVLAVVIFLFAFSTILTWSYYGEKSWSYLFGDRYNIVYKLLFLGSIILGAIADLDMVVDFSDTMLLAMAVPNILGCLLLSNQVAKRLDNYRLKLNLEQDLAN